MTQLAAIQTFMPESDHDKAFFSQAIQQNMDSLYAFAVRLTANAADAEDLVAEAVASAWAAFPDMVDRQRFRPWIFRILYNRFVSDYRRKKVRPLETAYEEQGDGKEQVASLLVQQSDDFLEWWANPEKEFASGLLGQQIMDAITELPEIFRVTVVLINIEGMSYDEAADVLSVSPGTIRSRMNRGRTLLQKALWQQAVEAGLRYERDNVE